MEKEKWKERFSKFLTGSKVVLAESKEALGKAQKAAVKFGDESRLKIQIAQLNSKNEKLKADIGFVAYKVFADEGKTSLEVSHEEVAKILADIKKNQEEIAKLEEELEKSRSGQPEKTEEPEKSGLAESEPVTTESAPAESVTVEAEQSSTTAETSSETSESAPC